MAFRAVLQNFSKGAIAKELEARFDISAYQAGLRRAENVVIRRTGGVQKRMGTRFVAECLGDSAHLLSFQFNDDQAYALEFGQAYMRPLALGGMVLEEGLAVTAITKAAQAQITAAYHGYVVGDMIYLKGILGMVEINDRPLTVVSVQDANNFTVGINSTNFGTFTGSGGGTVRVGPPAPPPPPPTVPAPATPPPPPEVGSGSSGSYDSNGNWTGVDQLYAPTGDEQIP